MVEERYPFSSSELLSIPCYSSLTHFGIIGLNLDPRSYFAMQQDYEIWICYDRNNEIRQMLARVSLKLMTLTLLLLKTGQEYGCKLTTNALFRFRRNQ